MLKKILCGATAALVLASTAAPAEARERRGRWHHHDRNDGIGAEEVVGGLLVVGAVAAIAGALTNRDGYGSGYRAEKSAVDACVREAEDGASRYHPARVTDIDNVEKRDGYYFVTGYMDVATEAPDPQEVGFTCTTRSGRIYDFQRGDGYHW